jgi:hypothetical protein
MATRRDRRSERPSKDQKKLKERADSLVTESSEASFPASDPPSLMRGSAVAGSPSKTAPPDDAKDHSDSMPSAGPHAKSHLTNPDATPGSGTLPPVDASSDPNMSPSG